MKRLILVLLSLLLLSGCASGQVTGDEEMAYTQIDQETAKQMMAVDDGHVVVDVRRRDEYEVLPRILCKRHNSVE